jgi:hypothetical protein
MIGELGAAFSKAFPGERLRRVKFGRSAQMGEVPYSGHNPSIRPHFLPLPDSTRLESAGEKGKDRQPTLCSLRDDLGLWPKMLINEGRGTTAE